jgi:hypothetical protein
VVEWWSGGVVEWWSGGVVEWWGSAAAQWAGEVLGKRLFLRGVMNEKKPAWLWAGRAGGGIDLGSIGWLTRKQLGCRRGRAV